MDEEQFDGHTPGPWVCEEPEEDEEPFHILYGTRLHGIPGEVTTAGDPVGYVGRCFAKHEEISVGEGCCRCEDACGECNECRDFAEIEANARLMAAAPELLAEAKRLRAVLAQVQELADSCNVLSEHSAEERAEVWRAVASRLHAIVGTKEAKEN